MSTLISKNVLVDGRRTSMRLEPAMWDALGQIAARENLTIHQICGIVNGHRVDTSLTSATRVFILGYFRVLAENLEREPSGGQDNSIIHRVFRQTAEFRSAPQQGRYAGSL
ncbi:ribbon-helix-helix domain-containing protein [Nisaea acidiphila]|uniref:Ribbon-helix-helix domain-containing protein n=1 Tax=Nisaea acidiphila TaxID=1862145 RepID=A0A9J7B1Y5_9PROT|nr:ribbon-helix-helix domain-containing protein [Nisaea acidiphila]UUX51677.1 ribbon-helix-helix domain-containing protein [Nisaea acidiphila]